MLDHSRQYRFALCAAAILFLSIIGCVIYISVAGRPEAGPARAPLPIPAPSPAAKPLPAALPTTSIPTDAAASATVASSYEPDLAQLCEQRDRLRGQVESLYSGCSKIRQDEQLIDHDPENPGAIVVFGGRGATFANDQRIAEDKAYIETLESQFAQLQEMGPDQFPDALTLLGIEDQSAQKMTALLQEAHTQELALVTAGVPANDLRLTSVRAQIESHQSLFAKQLDSIRRARKTNLEVERAHFNTLEEYRKAALDPKNDPKAIVDDYLVVKSHYLQAKAKLQEVEQRYFFAIFENLPPERIRDWRRLPTAPR